jgi:hypothetical protein
VTFYFVELVLLKFVIAVVCKHQSKGQLAVFIALVLYFIGFYTIQSHCWDELIAIMGYVLS